VRSALKGVHFQSVDEMQSKMSALLKSVSADDLRQCIDQSKIHMQQYRDKGENMFKGKEVIKLSKETLFCPLALLYNSYTV
jgi:hypothetical protein